MRCELLWTHLLLLLVLIVDSTDLTVKNSCRSHCGNTSIPYPFGIGKDCYFNEWFEIRCKISISGELVPYLPKINKEVVNIFLSVPPYLQIQQNPYGSLLIKTKITSMGCSNNTDASIPGDVLNVTGSPFTIDSTNKLIGVGCNNKATLTNLEPRLVGCITSCELIKEDNNSVCNGYRCCQTETLYNLGQVVGVSIEDRSKTRRGRGCRVAFLTDGSSFQSLQYNNSSTLLDPQWFHDRQYATVQLGWVIPMVNSSFFYSHLGCQADVSVVLSAEPMQAADSHLLEIPTCTFYQYSIGLTCLCNDGFTGNPYTQHGCKDIDECNGSSKNCPGTDSCLNTPGSYKCVTKKNKTLPIALGFSVGIGVFIFIGVGFWLYKFIKRRRKINSKKRFFKRNGGLLLQQQLTSSENNIEKTKVFNSKELKKATENFSLTRVLGQGAQGTVYKGMLADGRLVAVKKSKVVDEDKLKEFINEVIILSQINHRNIVKLLGCCLETEVPLLIYEFIPNGNLFEHLHDDSDDYTMATWEVRLRIAIDIAGALSYLHSAAAFPIYHRDIKTTNIMLDEKYRAKVADFGTSRSVTVDHTHLTTVVSGTAGYVDPEYFQSSQFSDKSDVYSFGVVLVELITGEKPVSFVRFQESRTLATYFILAMKENRLIDLIDSRIKDDCKVEQVMAAAQVARRCLNLNGKKRPSMREVSMELERIRSPPTGDSQPNAHIVEKEVAMEINIDFESYNNVGVTAPSMFQDSDASTSYFEKRMIPSVLKLHPFMFFIQMKMTSDHKTKCAMCCPYQCRWLETEVY